MKENQILNLFYMISARMIPMHLPESAGRIAVTGLFLGILAIVAWIDRKTMTIPDKLVLAVLGASLLSAAFFPEIGWKERILGMCSASLLLLAITLCVPGAFGGGDIKLMAACGVFLGWRYSLLALVAAVFFGAAYGGWMLATGKAERKTQIAFGPFLCMGMGIVILWGEQVLELLF